MNELQTVSRNVFTISEFLGEDACADLLSQIQRLEFEAASLGRNGSKMTIREVRNNDRIIWDNPTLADLLWDRLQSFPLPSYFGAEPVGLNERLRVYRYTKGQKFDWHADGRFQRANGEQSLYTFLLYLTEDFRGGETSFRDSKIIAQTGLACVFEHKLEHKGCEVIEGTKIVLRSDVMYSPLGKSRFLNRSRLSQASS